ncbi:MmcQ/YjbR family DNA-binding protein [Fructilactobacillus sp. Tb1]|uniref:MmcQ/YjbR family DNA-binding protein n=1 Tax=Fructilactobacillus sp. Tb1 TaxID=3422304 RepID=UPI003D2AEBA3
MKIDDLVSLVQKYSDGYLCFPFENPKRPSQIKTHVIKHKSNNKIIAIILVKDKQLLINLKLTPAHIQEMRDIRGIIPGYHMNKKHWNSILVNDTDLSKIELINMIKESAKLTK